ncbi:hypothetical protein H1R20_g16311, partial [Candolleomyces eurysporus]
MKPIKVWVAGESPGELKSPGLFITQVLQLVTWMHSSKANDILEYPAAQALCSWVGNILSQNYFPALAMQPADVMAVLTNLDTALPEVLPDLDTVPPNLQAHLRLKEETKKPKKVVPRPVKKVSEQAPVKVEKGEPLPKAKRPCNVSPEASRPLRTRSKRLPSPSKASKAKGKQRAISLSECEANSDLESEGKASGNKREILEVISAAANSSFVALDDDDDVDQLVSSPHEDPPPKKLTAKRQGRKVSSVPIIVDEDEEEPSSPRTPTPKPAARAKPKPVVEIPAVPSSSHSIKTAVPREDRILPARAIRVYKALALPSVFLANPEAATLLVMRPELAEPVHDPASSLFPSSLLISLGSLSSVSPVATAFA